MVLPFAGASAPPLSLFSLLFSASYPQVRSYYLFFNYLFFNYLYGYAVTAYAVTEESPKGCGNSVENSPESHKPVEIRDLRLLTDS